MTVDSRAPLEPGRLYFGWQYALLHPDPGPPPKRPTPPEQHRVHPEWMDAQRRAETQLNRPLMFAGALALGMAVFFALLSWPLNAVPGWGAAVAIGICLVLAGVAGYAVWQGERALRSRQSDERDRLERMRADRERRLNAAQEDHARRFDGWRARKAAYDAQHEWYALTLPRGFRRVDVAGGTLSGWKAFVSTVGASSMDAGREVTVVDLTEGAVASDLLELAADRDPQVWALPEDLSRLDLGAGLDAESLCDVLSLVVNVSEERGTPRDLSVDNVILQRVLEVFGGRASIAQVTAALGALIQIGDPREDVERGLLSREQLDRLGRTFGLGASDRAVYERVWTLQAQLRKLKALGSDAVPVQPAQLRVVSASHRAGVLGGGVLGTYVVSALLHELRRTPRQEPWSRTLLVCGADKLRGDVLDRLHDGCRVAGIGLVSMYGSTPAHVTERLGRGEAPVAFMRMDNAEDAKLAVEHVGREQRLVLGELTESLGTLVVDPSGESYTSTQVAAAAAGRGRTTEVPWGGLEDSSWPHGKERDGTDGELLSRGATTNTFWGRATAHVVGRKQSSAGAARRSREFVVEPSEMQRLPATAFVLTHKAPEGRRVVCGDANPAIVSLPQATRRELGEAGREEGPLPGGPVAGSLAEHLPEDVPAPQQLGGPQGARGMYAAPGWSGRPAAPSGEPSRTEQPPSAPDAPPLRTYDAGQSAQSAQAAQAEESRTEQDAGPGPPDSSSRDVEKESEPAEPTPDTEHAPEEGESDELSHLPPNLGPPPERLDWRRGR